VPIAVITFDFDPLLRLTADLVVRWQTVALAVVIAATLLLAGVIGRRSGLRGDDLLYLAVGVVPGAVIGGRLGYALLHAERFGSDLGRLVDGSQPGMDLAAGVVGGLLTGAYVASLLGTEVGRWAHIVALPLLVLLGAGKLTMVLGGSGQGLPFSEAWATAYLGPGPWGSLAPALPSHPSQAYEGLATLLFAVVLVSIVGGGAFRRRDGRLLLTAIGGWALLRAAVSVTWRDPAVLGPFGAAGVLTLVVAVACGLSLIALTVAGRRQAGQAERAQRERDALTWPDAESRPRF
jgi:prolipoprotein diacylglyceryltransferase